MYHVGLVEAYFWYRANGGQSSYRAQRDIVQNLLWLKKDVEAYEKKHGTLPVRLADVDLTAFHEHGDPQRLDAQGQPLDAWNRPYLYATKSGQIDLRSLGRDGIPGGTRLDADVSLDQSTWYYNLPSLQEFLLHQSEMPERSETSTIAWVCAVCPLLIFALGLYRRLREPSRMSLSIWIPAVTAIALLAGVIGPPMLFVLFLVCFFIWIMISMFLFFIWLIITYWFGYEVPPIDLK